jgi:hypothetical protein
VSEFVKSKRIRELFGCEDDTIKMNRTNRIKINYNEQIFFKPPSQSVMNKDNINLTNIVNNIINTTPSSRGSHKSRDSSNNIKFNVNINNNYYNSNHNYIINTEVEQKKKVKEDTGITGFFSKIAI